MRPFCQNQQKTTVKFSSLGPWEEDLTWRAVAWSALLLIIMISIFEFGVNSYAYL